MSITLTIQDGNERLTNYGGLALIGALLDSTRITERVSGIVLPSCVNPTISPWEIVGLTQLGSTIPETRSVIRVLSNKAPISASPP